MRKSKRQQLISRHIRNQCENDGSKSEEKSNKKPKNYIVLQRKKQSRNRQRKKTPGNGKQKAMGGKKKRNQGRNANMEKRKSLTKKAVKMGQLYPG